MLPRGWHRFRAVGAGGRRTEREVDDELEFHLEMRVRRLVAGGMDESQARAEAFRQFGDLDTVRREVLGIENAWERSMKRASRWREARHDIMYAVRTIRRQPLFALVVILSLALGMGSNTAVFTLVDALLLRPLPVSHPERLVAIGNTTRVSSVSTGGARTDLFSVPVYRDVRDASSVMSGLAATGRTTRLDVSMADSSVVDGLGGESGIEHPRGRLVSGNYFGVLGVRSFIGRTFTGDDDQVVDGSPVVVLSHGYWKRRFAEDRGVIGRAMRVNGREYTIIGVTERGFTGEIVGRMTDLWFPLTMQPALSGSTSWLDDRNVNWLLFMGRMSPGVTVERVSAVLPSLITRSIDANASVEDLNPATIARRDPVPVASGARGLSYTRMQFGEALLTLMVAVGLVLLIVCANVSNLLFARGAARGREMSVRAALGAGRMRLLRQLLTESVLLVLLSGVVGFAIAWWGGQLLLKLATPGPSALPLALSFDVRMFGFVALLMSVTVLLSGLGPALRATSTEPAATLRGQGRGVTGGFARSPGRRLAIGPLLVAGQVALSLMLLVGTSLLVRSMRGLETQSVGLSRDRLLIVEVDPGPTQLEGLALQRLADVLLQRLRRIQGVQAASYSENGIFSGTESGTTINVPGFTAPAFEDTVVAYDRVGDGYFDAIGATLLRGRGIDETDRAGSPGVIVINESMARFFFGEENAVGRHVTVEDRDREIVGVVGDVRDHQLRGEASRRMYLPLAQTIEHEAISTIKYELRAADPAAIAADARRVLADAYPGLRLLDARPLPELMRESISSDRLVARLVGFFGILALVLAALGLYGVLSYATVRRTSEFGLRIALGAEPGEVTRMVLRQAMVIVVAGGLIGLPLALGAASLLRNQLFGVSPLDPLSIGVALLVLFASAAFAGWLPAARASRVSPLVALRTE